MDKKSLEDIRLCPKQYVLAINDTMNVLSGKWKLPILASLLYGKNRFKDIMSNVDNITPRMLSKALKELEINGVVERLVHDSTPVLIEYSLTESGERITEVLDVMIEWGLTHRKSIMSS